ncbi:MAG: hypothetical protein KF767_01310 [Bdellovibrionaceae bacterium]|nr:hypothetical protein [Pseudobdellovibrionaceae bacterium]
MNKSSKFGLMPFCMRLRDFQQDINKKFKLLTETMGEAIGEFSETLQSPRARALLSSALEFVKPHHLALGLRVSRLSTTRIEVVVPLKARAPEMPTGEASEAIMDPGVLTTAANLGAQLLLRRQDQAELGIGQISEAHLRFVGPVTSTLRGRLEFSKIAQESLRAELKKNGRAEIELVMAFFDDSERLVADCSLQYVARHSEQLTWTEKGSDDTASNTN